MTAMEIIKAMMREIRVLAVGEVPSASDAEVCLEALNGLVDAWQVEPNFASYRTEVVFTLTGGAQFEQIGSGLAIDVAAPVRIEGGFCRDSERDYPFDPCAHQEYTEIRDKGTASFTPCAAHYDGNGKVFFWPPAASDMECHLFVLAPLQRFANLTTDYPLPPGYAKTLKLTGAEEIADQFHKAASPSLARRAANARRVLKRSNVQVPQMDVCSEIGHLVVSRSGVGNYVADEDGELIELES